MPEMPKAALLDTSTLGDGIDLTPLDNLSIQLKTYESTASDDILKRIHDAEIVLTNKVVLSAAIINQCSELKYIGVLATGLNNVDLVAAEQSAIIVKNVERYCTDSVAQHTMALMLSLATALPAYSRDSRNGRWSRSDKFCLLDYPILELKGKKLLIVGGGELGAAVAKLAEAFGMQVMKARVPGSSTVNDRIDLDKGLSEADVVSLHCPLTPETHHLINAGRLKQMKPSALLLNTARGGLVDEQALVNALESGSIRGAGFDVLTEEPPRLGNVLLEYDAPNLLITPHTAWASPEARQRVVNIAGEHLRNALNQLC